jgi:N-acetylglucosaminyldiphosphoundecaprenol N-acetyl-beta-D-mannosaminyltransferase
MTTNESAVDILGVPVNVCTLDDVLDKVEAAIQTRENLHIGVVNAAKIVNMRRDEELRQSVLDSDLILADGIAVVWASKILRRALPGRVTGIDLMFGMFARGNKKNYRVFCLGATEEVSTQVAHNLKRNYPHVILAGRRNGYFSAEQEAEVAQQIAEAKPDILLVAMTSPKKERFMAKWNPIMQVPVVHGVGGSFDVMAGKVERAPALWQKLGLEWLYRVKQEPGRLWKRYLVTNTLFCWLTFKALFRRS